MRWKNGRGNSEIEYDKTCRRKTVAGFVYARYNGLQQTETRKEGADMAVHVWVVPYDSCWPELFRREAEAVGRILGSNRKEIHHIGSTAVTGLAAKPVIDMMPVVWELEAAEACYAQFEAIGYEGMKVWAKWAGRADDIFARAGMTAPIRSIFSAQILKKISTGIWRCAITCAQTTGRRQPMERSSCSWRGSFRRIWKGIAKAKMHL